MSASREPHVDRPVTPHSAAAHVYVESVEEPVLAAPDRHHLARVLRLRPGDPITVGDGRGAWRPVRFDDVLVPTGGVVHEPRPAVVLAVAFAVVKGDRPELIVRALTEIGVDRIQPIHTERSVVRWRGERAAESTGRLRRIARAAGMQSRRVWLPEVAEPSTLAALDVDFAMALADAAPLGADCWAVAVGPEGGWTAAELADGRAAGRAEVGLGPHVMRTETAAIAAAALLVRARSAVN